MTDRNGVWDVLERWRTSAFLIGGVLFLAIAVNFGFRVVANIGMNVDPIVPMVFLLPVFVGLLGLSPRLLERTPRVTRVGQILILILVAEAGLLLGVLVVPSASIQRATHAMISATAILGAMLTVTVYGAASLWTRAYSRPVGSFLLLAAFGLFIGVVGVVLYGDPGPEWLDILVNGTFGSSLIVVGYALRSEGTPTGQARSADTVA